ncbi:MAG TPA: lipid carrier--UDP-N-acetylgalactosaminyltransferase [Cyanobacteria bacterium UBA8530]|nr:lipid carrier--UDP-N-acetylgalactosaminyltransferase [Cyanobacteria bacterium UBA8530]
MEIRWPPKNRDVTVRRVRDILASSVGLAIIWPLILLLAALVKLDSPGPAIFKQKRVGYQGRPFTLYKFRTMVVGAEGQQPEIADFRTHKFEPLKPPSRDPRVTNMGWMLRRLSLDELPQLLNVLKGDMSLVGPRPERPHFVDQFRHYVPKYMDRHLVRSGLTGWAQINGQRGQEGSIEERTRYDIYYIENWSPLFDLRIIIKTVLEVMIHPTN